MPGSRTSEAYTCEPLTLAGMSKRAGEVPAIVHSFGDLRGGFSGTGSVDAKVASSP